MTALRWRPANQDVALTPTLGWSSRCDPLTWWWFAPNASVWRSRPDSQVSSLCPPPTRLGKQESHLDNVPIAARSRGIRGAKERGLTHRSVKNVPPKLVACFLQLLAGLKSSSGQSIEGRGTDTATPIAATTAERGRHGPAAGLSIQIKKPPSSLRSGVRDSGSPSGDWVQGREKRVHRSPQARASQEDQNPMRTYQIHKLARARGGTSFGLGDSSLSVFGRDGLLEGSRSRRRMAH